MEENRGHEERREDEEQVREGAPGIMTPVIRWQDLRKGVFSCKS